MEYLGLLFELLFLVLGVYLLLFSFGYLRTQDPEAKARAEAFRARNKWWLGIAAALLILLMTANLVLHLMQLFG